MSDFIFYQCGFALYKWRDFFYIGQAWCLLQDNVAESASLYLFPIFGRL